MCLLLPVSLCSRPLNQGNMGHVLIDVFRNTLMITSFVVIIMLCIELLNVFTRGSWYKWIHRYKSLQVIIATFLGLIPGCFGGFAAVSLWTHGAISFGALVAALVAGMGDEAFVMLVRMPEKMVLLMSILFVIALTTGFVIDKLSINVKLSDHLKDHLHVHEHETVSLSESFRGWRSNFQPISFTRVLLLTGIGLFLVAFLTGSFDHEQHDALILPTSEPWFNSIFLILSLFVLVTFIIVNDHFLEDHLWKHIIKQHVPRIALWTFMALLLIHFVTESIDVQQWVHDNSFWILILAILIGLIPESGPHLVFITLFLSGSIPFSILLANTIVQDGHGSLPLFAESKRGFIYAKLIKAGVALVVGSVCYLCGI
jgi:hypothetical protein